MYSNHFVFFPVEYEFEYEYKEFVIAISLAQPRRELKSI